MVAVTDYEGCGSRPAARAPSIRFWTSTTAGYSLIDAVRAAKNLVPDTSPIWAAVGDTGERSGFAWA